MDMQTVKMVQMSNGMIVIHRTILQTIVKNGIMTTVLETKLIGLIVMTEAQYGLHK